MSTYKISPFYIYPIGINNGFCFSMYFNQKFVFFGVSALAFFLVMGTFQSNFFTTNRLSQGFLKRERDFFLSYRGLIIIEQCFMKCKFYWPQSEGRFTI